MNYSTLKKIYIVSITLLTSYSSLNAALITIDAPEKNASNRNPVTVHIVLDAEQDTISGMAGNFSFPTDLYSLGDISTESSVVSLWVKQPSVSDEVYLDGRTHIPFEGIFPGGYSGVRSPYYSGTHPGTVFSVTLIPKNSGKGAYVVDDISLHAFNSNATLLQTTSAIRFFETPHLSGVQNQVELPRREVNSSTLTAFITKDALINNNAWYLVVNEREQKSSVKKIVVAETNNNYPPETDDYSWRSVTIPYVLLHQDRSKFIHIKVIYSNNTYTLRTLPPVENSQGILFDSRILVGIALALLVLYFYVKHFSIYLPKQSKNTT